MKQFIFPIISSLIVGATVYGFSYESDPAILLEKQNRKAVMECINNLDDFTGSTIRLQDAIMECASIELSSINGTSTPDTEGEAGEKDTIIDL